MVKILKCHNFVSQNILSDIKSEPVCLTAGKTSLFAGTASPSVEVFKQKETSDKEGEWVSYCSFQTSAPVEYIEYNSKGDYVVTIEHKASRISDVISVKVYLNWNIGHTTPTYRTRVRVAGLGYRSLNVETGKHLEVVDVPCEKPVRSLSSCQETGNIALVMGTTIKVYTLVKKTIPNTSTTYLDVILFFSLLFTFPISHVTLCEDFIGCTSSEVVQVFQMKLTNEKLVKPSSSDRELELQKGRRSSSSVASSLHFLQQQQQHLKSLKSSPVVPRMESPRYSSVGERSSATPSPAHMVSVMKNVSAVEDDQYFVQWDFKASQEASLSVVAKGNQQDPSLKFKGIEYFGQQIRTSPILPSTRDHRGGSHNTTGSLTVRQLLYRYINARDAPWIHIQLIPTYLTAPSDGMKNDDDNVLRSCRYPSLQGVSVMVSSAMTGYLYSLLPESTLLSTYEYSSKARQLLISRDLMYVLVNSSLETYTGRWNVAALTNSQRTDLKNVACPSPKTEVCMLGVQSFFGPKAVASTGQHLVLLNKIENEWNVNVLREPGTVDLYHEIVGVANKFQTNTPNYLHLLLEGHMTLKSSLIGHMLGQSELSTVEDLLRESCAMLGEQYAHPDCDEWYLCLPYYMMSGLSPLDVIRQVMQLKLHSKQESHQYGAGLAQYLKHVLFMQEDPLEVKQTDADMILSICNEVMPERLVDVILTSRVSNFTPEVALDLLRQSETMITNMHLKTKTKMKLAAISLHLSLCEPDVAHATLLTIDKADLVEVLVATPQLLVTGLTELSPIGQLLRRHCSEVLIDTMILQYDEGYFSMDLALRLLQGSPGSAESYTNIHIMSYLEKLLSDDSRQYCFEDAAVRLCEMYIRRIQEWKPPSIRHITPSVKFKLPRPTGHFGPRHSWLDEVPPFSGTRSVTAPCKYLVVPGKQRAGSLLLQCQRTERGADHRCPCFLCNEDLLKLQSLLCWLHVSSVLCEHVLSLLRDDDQSRLVSVHLLCHIRTDMQKAIQIIVRDQPRLMGSFAASVLKQDPCHWEYLLKCFLSQYSQNIEGEDEREDQSKSYLSDALRQMAGSLTPDLFLKVLPSNGNLFFFLPYICLCIENHRNRTLSKQITDLGETLSRTVTCHGRETL